MMSVDKNDLIKLDEFLTKSIRATECLRDRWERIKWESIDKDNMEFSATISCYQKEEIEAFFRILIGNSRT